MRRNTFKACLMAGTLIGGFGLSTASAVAQEEGAEPEDRVIVTGTRIPSANLVSTSPVTQIDAEEFQDRGNIRVEDMVNTLPQAFAGQGSNISNGSTGTATVNLRGIGAARTLVLVNGRRLPYGSPRAVAADLNQVPGALIERVEVLTGGASAVYGSDAIAGVVNFYLNDSFEGVRFDAQYSFYQHTNDNSIQTLVNQFNAINPQQYRNPDDRVIDGAATQLSGVMGVNTPDGRGNATLYVTYRNVAPVYQANRDYSACAFGTRNGGTEFTCSGSSTNATANFLNLAQPNTPLWFRTNGSQFIARDFTTDTFNFNPFNFYQRPDTRYVLGANSHYEINRHFDLYTEMSFMDTRSLSQIAPSGVFGGGVAGSSGGINCNNPFLTAQQVNYICTANGLGPNDTADGILILRRNVEGGPRQSDIRHTMYRGVFGSRGDFFNTGLSYDMYGSYANVHLAENYRNEISIRKSSLALNAVRDGAGNIVCAVNADADTSNDDPNCVPYNIFSGTPSQAAVNYIQNPLLQDGTTTQQVLSASVFGDLFGIQSPAADTPVAFAVGTEYRQDTLTLLPDANYQAGDGFGQGGPTTPVSGGQDVYELFTELRVPIIEGRPGFEFLNAEFAYRFSSYSSGVETDTYKAALEWSPVPDLRARASLQRAVRAANVIELFSTQSIGLFDLSSGPNGNYDPCSGPTPSASLTQCQRTGVTAAQYGNIADNPAGQFNALFGGNPNLAPETADTITLGVVFSPDFIPGLTVSVDYFDITVEDLVGTIPPSQALAECLATGDAAFCSLINRGNGGTLWANQTGFITATNINTGSLSTDGFDVNAVYSMDLDMIGPNAGSLSFDLVGTYLNSLETVSFPGATPFDCVGFYGSSCGTPNPEWRHKFRTTWVSTYNFDASLTWRHFASVNLFGGGAAINNTLDAQNYFDVSGNWYMSDDMRFRFGVNNVLDSDPPLSSAVGAGFGNGNTFPQVYDAIGRYVFAGVTVDF